MEPIGFLESLETGSQTPSVGVLWAFAEQMSKILLFLLLSLTIETFMSGVFLVLKKQLMESPKLP